jgi:hypothetical protein
MKIKFSRNGQQFAEYPEEAVPALLQSKVVFPTDYFWHESIPGNEWAIVATRWPTAASMKKNKITPKVIVYLVLAIIVPLWPFSAPLFLWLAYREYRKSSQTPASTESNQAKKPRMSAAGVVLLGGIALVAFACIFTLVGPVAESGHKSGGSRAIGGVLKLEKSYVPTYTVQNIGRDLALSVWNEVVDDSGVKTVVITVYLNPSGLFNDRYGNRVRGRLKMGEIVIRDVDEIRRYKTEGAYSVANKDWYSGQVGGMEYASNLGM